MTKKPHNFDGNLPDMTGAKFIPMRMIYQSVEIVTFHNDAEMMAKKIHEMFGVRVCVYEVETSGHNMMRHEKLAEFK